MRTMYDHHIPIREKKINQISVAVRLIQCNLSHKLVFLRFIESGIAVQKKIIKYNRSMTAHL